MRAAGDFDLDRYTEASVQDVRHTERYGHVIFLRLKGASSILPVYIGEFECGALAKEIHKKPQTRPMTHDLMKNTLEALGYRVTKVRIASLVGNTYHARVHFARGKGIKDPGFSEIDVDARPSDAVNLAVRFGAPIYVNNDIASKMAHPLSTYEERAAAAAAGGGGGGASARHENHSEVARSCREEIAAYSDPTMMFKLQLQLAIADERFEDAGRLRDSIENVLANDRTLALVVAMETALEDGRFAEAARLRDEFRMVRQGQQQLAGGPDLGL